MGVSLKGHPIGLDDIWRFDKKVGRGGPDDCWLWTASANGAGYGQFKLGSTVIEAHRFALAVALPEDFVESRSCFHHCDRLRCCNPRHLFQKSTLRKRTRTVGVVRSPLDDVGRFVVCILARRGFETIELAQAFNVSVSTIRRILRESVL